MHKNVIVFLFFTAFLNCNNNLTKNGEADGKSSSKVSFPAKPLVIIGDNGDDHGPADIRLSITDIEENDTATLFKINSTFSAKRVGFLLSMPKSKEGAQGFGAGIILLSTGLESDNLLRVLDSLYEQKADTSMQFKKEINLNFVNLKSMTKNLAGKDAEPNTTTNEYKLFFEKEKKYAELYLNVNPQEHWIELNEKDEEYRPTLIDFLKK